MDLYIFDAWYISYLRLHMLCNLLREVKWCVALEKNNSRALLPLVGWVTEWLLEYYCILVTTHTFDWINHNHLRSYLPAKERKRQSEGDWHSSYHEYYHRRRPGATPWARGSPSGTNAAQHNGHGFATGDKGPSGLLFSIHIRSTQTSEFWATEFQKRSHASACQLKWCTCQQRRHLCWPTCCTSFCPTTYF